ncbi:hypothetical protein CROQUDRAFT_651725 [Cronartium quercuum f. sp. fusiforme G11]|uniref:DUSP domain-containing protein n=1 Tax=Cronartium quercuum f. sp. fusiforme G11 TaxID=708437 RepID=A0A9P6NWU8_9BASI|nr:hypothetical protein CROQUDRAFT_651725 [Cronartium quercuum f. sp. fusiforme G11]
MQAGQTWYLINLIWFKRWQEACGSIDQPIKLKTTQNFDPITIQTSKRPELLKRGTMKSMVNDQLLDVGTILEIRHNFCMILLSRFRILF